MPKMLASEGLSRKGTTMERAHRVRIVNLLAGICRSLETMQAGPEGRRACGEVARWLEQKLKATNAEAETTTEETEA
jgi:hypothetical protein